MGYQVYEDTVARDYGVERWAGYGLPAVCDVKDCTTAIDRGMGYRCEKITTYKYTTADGDVLTDEEFLERGEASDIESPIYEEGCGLHFCENHSDHSDHIDVEPKPDTAEWVRFMLADESWERWRVDNPARVAQMHESLKEAS